LPHQTALISSIHKYPDITYIADVAGYGSGKSAAVSYLVLCLVYWYEGFYLTFGIGGAAIKHLVSTVIKDVITLLEQHKIPYKHNAQAGKLEIGTLTFVYFSLDRPDTIFGWNLAGCLCDEIDELSETGRAKEAILAIQERCRISLPATPRQPVARSPFITITTTAQGMRGLYILLEFFREKGIPYIHIRGSTKDNIYLDKKQIENLYKMYTPEEARAYLDGEFINLSTGRVFAEFDPAKHVFKIDEIGKFEPIYVGLDMNFGFNMSVAAVERDGILCIFDEFHFNVVGDAPRILRMKYQDNPITLIPDAAGKEIMAGVVEEMEQYGIDYVLSNINPPITERVLAVNKLCRTQRFFVDPTCRRAILSLQVQGFDDTGKPAKGKGPDAPDHIADAMEYMVWFIIHSIAGFEAILDILRGPKLDRWGEVTPFREVQYKHA
jgi:hypothetical protein